MKPRSRKAKGRRHEGAVAERLRAWTGLDEDHIERSRASYSGEDMEMSKEAKAALPYWFECKNHKTLAIPAWLAQIDKAIKKAKDTRVPVLVFRLKNKRKRYAVVDLEHFLLLATRFDSNRGSSSYKVTLPGPKRFL
jgi:hypothetical protein